MHRNWKIDIVYTWVDDKQQGYMQNLRQHAVTELDCNPNRTRDNLDLLKYSLRSAERYLGWQGNIYLFTCRPQKPRWLNAGNNRLRVIHHDSVIDGRYLPTFNSFCIVSHLARLEGLSDPFLYLEDDMLFAADTSLSDFMTSDLRLILYPRLEKTTPASRQHADHLPPWNKALSCSNHLLDVRYGKRTRHSINRVPLLVFKEVWEEMIHTWQDAFEYTCQSRFRKLRNVAPEYIYPYYCLYEGRAQLARFRDTYRKSFYLGLDNNLLLAKAGLFLLDKIRPQFYCLNDNFGESPDPRVEQEVRQLLEKIYPQKSSFEI